MRAPRQPLSVGKARPRACRRTDLAKARSRSVDPVAPRLPDSARPRQSRGPRPRADASGPRAGRLPANLGLTSGPRRPRSVAAHRRSGYGPNTGVDSHTALPIARQGVRTEHVFPGRSAQFAPSSRVSQIASGIASASPLPSLASSTSTNDTSFGPTRLKDAAPSALREQRADRRGCRRSSVALRWRGSKI